MYVYTDPFTSVHSWNYCGDRIGTDRKNHDCCLLSSSRKGPAYVFEILMAPTDLVPAWVTTRTSYWFSSRRSSLVCVSLSRARFFPLRGCGKPEPALTLSAHTCVRPSNDWSLGIRERERERERKMLREVRPCVSRPFLSQQTREYLFSELKSPLWSLDRKFLELLDTVDEGEIVEFEPFGE